MLRVAAAYSVVAWIIIEAGSVLLPTFGASEAAFKIYVLVVIAGLVVALGMAWAFEVTPDGVKLEKNVDREKSITKRTGRKLDLGIIGLLAVALAVSVTLNVTGMRDAAVDPAGITAQFNLNMLHNLNRQFGSNFDPDAFDHRASFNELHGRIEMHLVSTREQSVTVGERLFNLDKNESICTEYSYKYTLEQFSAMAAQAGFSVENVWTDPRRWFSLQLCIVV